MSGIIFDGVILYPNEKIYIETKTDKEESFVIELLTTEDDSIDILNWIIKRETHNNQLIFENPFNKLSIWRIKFNSNMIIPPKVTTGK